MGRGKRDKTLFYEQCFEREIEKREKREGAGSNGTTAHHWIGCLFVGLLTVRPAYMMRCQMEGLRDDTGDGALSRKLA